MSENLADWQLKPNFDIRDTVSNPNLILHLVDKQVIVLLGYT